MVEEDILRPSVELYESRAGAHVCPCYCCVTGWEETAPEREIVIRAKKTIPQPAYRIRYRARTVAACSVRLLKYFDPG